MNKEYVTHWILGTVCALIWFWGDRAGIPKDAQLLAASVVPGLLGNALGISKGQADISSPPAAPAVPQPQPQPEQST